nr:hypothetical protein HmN_001014200 [Hymenolepis microstoma]
MIANPVKEFDIELFQTDTRKPSKELPDLFDGFNPLHVDIHNFLPEHSSIPIKGGDKLKMKAAKPTAANKI